MRIVHVSPCWADAWAYGGIPRIVGALARAQAAAGHHVTVCATDACSATSRLRLIPGATTERPWPVQHLAPRLDLRVFPNVSNRMAYDLQGYLPRGLLAYLRDQAHDFDVGHIHACRNLLGALAAHFLSRYEVPFVLQPNGTAPNYERRRLAKGLFDVVVGRRILGNAAAVIAVTQAEHADLLALGLDPARIHVIPNPVDLDEFATPVARGRFRARAGIGQAPLVAFLGKVTPRKRLDTLIRAFASLPPDVRLVVAGSDMGGLDEARALASRLEVADRVQFPGLLSGRHRLELLADADVVSYPSQDEVFGLVPLEALLAGTPVVVAGDSGCGEVIARVGGGEVVPVGDPLSLAAATRRLMARGAEGRAAAAAAADRIRRIFAPDLVAGQVADLYRRVAASPASVGTSGVSVIVPVRNGAETVARSIASIEAQADGRPMEIIVVDDRSADAGAEWLRSCADAGRIRLLTGRGGGPSAAINLGLSAARHPFIAQVDQDVELLPGWLARLSDRLERDGSLGAVEGQYIRDGTAPVVARVMAMDLELRYAALRQERTDHVCTGNTMYRARAIASTGGFDEQLGYGGDNDMSYRLQARGWRLAHCARARSFHRWRDTVAGYWWQQYGFGYGRLEVVARHPGRAAGDEVSPWVMMAHPIVLGIALVLFAVGAGAGWSGRTTLAFGTLAAAAALIGVLAVERSVVAVRAFIRFGDPAAFLFPVLHLLRDAAWVTAIGTWLLRRVAGRASTPLDSMRRRPVSTGRRKVPRAFIPKPVRTIGIIPVHNEAATIARVVSDLRDTCPDLDLLIVDDGSTDRSPAIIERLGVTFLRLPERLGVGSAMRAGLRYAQGVGYDAAVRVDGDGQHRGADIARLRQPIDEGLVDVVLGSRFLAPSGAPRTPVRVVSRLLAMCLSAITRRDVTDPTSGFCALGPRAMRLLADHHPTGYPEPELHLLLSRHDLRVLEVPVQSHPRLAGRTSLTAGRLTAAGARVLLALLVVPLRSGDGWPDGD